MSEVIRIDKFEHKVSKNGKPYGKVNGTYSVFEESIIAELKDAEGKTYELETAESNGFKNIRGVIKEILNGSPAPIKNVAQQALKQEIKEELASNEVVVKKERPNSAEFGKAGERVKIYFSTAEDLDQQVQALKEAGFFPQIAKLE